MKFLTSVTIILTLPTMVASFFGMNVPVPWANNPYGFIFYNVNCIRVISLVAFIFWKRKYF